LLPGEGLDQIAGFGRQIPGILAQRDPRDAIVKFFLDARIVTERLGQRALHEDGAVIGRGDSQ
jgi:hypothetical protein